MEYHVPVLLKESIDGLNIKDDGIYLDLTYGGGGHSQEILRRIKNGRLIAFDQDKDVENNLINDDRFTFFQSNYRFFKRFLKYQGIEKVDGILADLGVSSYHFESESRGFSFRFNSALDMRMNISSELTARDVLNDYSEEQLIKILSEYGEVANSRKIVSEIIKFRKNNKLETTNQLLDVISTCIPENQSNKYLAKVFQAIRIEVNNELEALKSMLINAIDTLSQGGRLVVISYHSLEDRLVKNIIKAGNFEGKIEKDFYGNIDSPLKAVFNKVIIPDVEEIKNNKRARSAKLRIAERI